MKRRLHWTLQFPSFRSVQLWATITALLFAPLFFGSVDLFWIASWTVLLSISALCGLAVPTYSSQSRILLGFFFLCAIYAAVAFVQLTPDLFEQFNDPAWRRMNELLDLQVSPRISSRAEIPPLAIGHFLAFATSFVSGFFVGTSKNSSARLVQFTQYSIFFFMCSTASPRWSLPRTSCCG